MRDGTKDGAGGLIVRDEGHEVQVVQGSGYPTQAAQVVPRLPQYLEDEGWTIDMGKVINIKETE